MAEVGHNSLARQAEEGCQCCCACPAAHRRRALLCRLRPVQGFRFRICALRLSRLCPRIHSRRSVSFHGSSSPVDAGPRNHCHGSCRGLRRIPDWHIAAGNVALGAGTPALTQPSGWITGPPLTGRYSRFVSLSVTVASPVPTEVEQDALVVMACGTLGGTDFVGSVCRFGLEILVHVECGLRQGLWRIPDK